MSSDAVKIARLNDKRAKREEALNLLRQVTSDPLLVGLAALAGNEMAYRAGLYDPKAGEAPQSILGGSVWWEIGTSLPAAQAKRNLVQNFIIGVTTARALAPLAPAMIQGGLNAGKALALVAGA